ncbi:MAG: hypothetical protein R6V15_13160 [Desulfotignum sp.]
MAGNRQYPSCGIKIALILSEEGTWSAFYAAHVCAWKAVLTLRLKKEKKHGINPDTGIKTVRGNF